MERQQRTVDTRQLMQVCTELLQTGAVVPLVVSGGSMLPFLADGRDTVYLRRAEGLLRRGQIALYRRDGGSYVLHRVASRRKDGYVMLGDAQTQLEYGVQPSQLVAVVEAVDRKGRRLTPRSACWRFYATVWLWLRPLQRTVMDRVHRQHGRRN